MGPSGGGRIAAKRCRRAKPPSGAGAGEDRLSALPDDILVLILLRLDPTDGSYAAGRTSVLSRRWRRVWALLPDLSFPLLSEPGHIATALAAHGAAALRDLSVVTADANAESVASLLAAAAARRISGRLDIFNISLKRGDAAAAAGEEDPNNPAGEAVGPVDRGAFGLPCLGDATAVSLRLGYLGLAFPPAAVFARLTELSLISVRFGSRCDLGGALSSPRCPSLEKLTIRNAIGLVDLAIHSESLLQLVLCRFDGLEQLTIVAPALEDLNTTNCFPFGRPVADISTPKLVKLQWKDPYDPSTVQFSNMGSLQSLSLDFFHVYGQHDSEDNRNLLKFLQRFQLIDSLAVSLFYRQVISNLQYLMDDITRLPHISILTLLLASKEHSFGASAFHILKLCTGIRKLRLMLLGSSTDLKELSACPSGCICDQPTDWKSEELLLNSLEVVVLFDLKGADNEVAFVKRLLNWATKLKMMTITFDCSVSGNKAAEVCRALSSLARPETCKKFYRYRSADNKSCYLFANQLAKAGDSLSTGYLHFIERV
ncbi:unnamed protein product [Urochloa decumbens]|uniref:F-box domain-containing protein n=1 Tax=Urochloa decumbens TaxID=240449 RepID=A0ABC9BZZ9_9POAL